MSLPLITRTPILLSVLHHLPLCLASLFLASYRYVSPPYKHVRWGFSKFVKCLSVETNEILKTVCRTCGKQTRSSSLDSLIAAHVSLPLCKLGFCPVEFWYIITGKKPAQQCSVLSKQCDAAQLAFLLFRPGVKMDARPLLFASLVCNARLPGIYKHGSTHQQLRKASSHWVISWWPTDAHKL